MNEIVTDNRWKPTQLWTPVMIWLIALMIIKLLCLSVIIEGKTCLSAIGTYEFAIWGAFVLNIPEGIFRKKWLQVALMLTVDFTAIILFPSRSSLWSLISLSLVGALVSTKLSDTVTVPTPGKIQYFGYLCVWSILSAIAYLTH